MAKVFISYARANEAAAAAIAQALEDQGDTAWWDKDLPAHRRYSEVLEEKLEECDAVLVLWSKSALESEWVRSEADVARNARKLIQASLDGTLPPIPFNQTHCVELKRLRAGRPHRNWDKVDRSIRALCAEDDDRPANPKPASRGFAPMWALAAIVLLALGIGGFLAYRSWFAGPDGPTTVAILPFTSAGADNEALSEGVWEDTRTAVARNPQLRVLGRETVNAVAAQGLTPADYAKKFGVDFLLGGSVRRVDDRIRMTVSLVDTRTGVETWAQQFDRKLDDVLALQLELAREIEGRVRGRLAEGGGRLPHNIATSGTNYALYAKARALIHKRSGTSIREGHAILRKVLEDDPNYAPAWAALSMAERLAGAATVTDASVGSGWEDYARRAIALAPNLGAGYAALGLGTTDPAVARQALERAVALDGSDVESLMWLGSAYGLADDQDKALEMYRRAFAIDPLFRPLGVNYLDTLARQGRSAELQTVSDRLIRLGARDTVIEARLTQLIDANRFADAARFGLGELAKGDADKDGYYRLQLAQLLATLGHTDLFFRIVPKMPAYSVALGTMDPAALDIVDSEIENSVRLWKGHQLIIMYVRNAAVNGRDRHIVDHYRASADSPAEFLRIIQPETFIRIAPELTLALRHSGDARTATTLLEEAERQTQSPRLAEEDEMLAIKSRLAAVRGDRRAATALFVEAVGKGFRPLIPNWPVDPVDDIAWRTLTGEPGFERARRILLAFNRAERVKLGQVVLPA